MNRPRPTRLLVVCPSWLGDGVMATPALRLLRDGLPGAFIGGLVRPGVDRILDGAGFFDEVVTDRAQGMMGPKRVAARLRSHRFDGALLLTNSFSAALTTRLAFIRVRVGYDRDGRGILLTHRLQAPKDQSGRWSPIPAVSYYHYAARAVLEPVDSLPPFPPTDLPPGARLELATTEEDERNADELFERAGIAKGERFAILNPGGNNPAKRWPADRFASLVTHLAHHHDLRVVVNGSPEERELAETICAETSGVSLPALAPSLSTLKAIVRRSALMVTNDTGPRHIAAAFGVPLVSLFGPTDPRWTTIPARERIVVADPTLPHDQCADHHPVRCAIGRISIERVVGAVDDLLSS